MMKCGIALGLHSYFSDEGALSLFSKIIMIEYLTSIFDIRFYTVSFSIKPAAPRPAAALNPEPRTLNPEPPNL
jgi:hypothetical protein